MARTGYLILFNNEECYIIAGTNKAEIDRLTAEKLTNIRNRERFKLAAGFEYLLAA